MIFFDRQKQLPCRKEQVPFRQAIYRFQKALQVCWRKPMFDWSWDLTNYVVLDKIDQARQKYIQLLQQKIGERIETLLNSPAAKKKSCCNPECDAKYLGLVLRKLTENKISYSASVPSLSCKPCSPFFTVCLENVSPSAILPMVANMISSSATVYRGSCLYSHCENRGRSLFGNDAACEAANLPTSL